MSIEQAKLIILQAQMAAYPNKEHAATLGRFYELVEELENYRSLGDIDRLRELVEADKEGRLVVLPCKVGDTVYMVSAVGCGDNVYHCDKPCNGTWENCKSYDESLRIDEIPFSYFRIPDIGKTVFPTRAEAEAALAKEEETP